MTIDFPGGPVIKNFTCQNRGHRFSPWSGKIPHVIGQLSSCSIPTESVLKSPWATTAADHALQQEKAPQSKTHVAQLKNLHSPQLEKAWVQQQRPNAVKNKYN